MVGGLLLLLLLMLLLLRLTAVWCSLPGRLAGKHAVMQSVAPRLSERHGRGGVHARFRHCRGRRRAVRAATGTLP